MDRFPVAEHVQVANRQHYEVPAEFFALALGPRRKYSCCLYPTGSETLAEAETLALEVTVERAGLKEGQRILELGCGWGSPSLFMAERFPLAHITAVSNSASQRRFIEDDPNLPARRKKEKSPNDEARPMSNRLCWMPFSVCLVFANVSGALAADMDGV